MLFSIPWSSDSHLCLRSDSLDLLHGINLHQGSINWIGTLQQIPYQNYSWCWGNYPQVRMHGNCYSLIPSGLPYWSIHSRGFGLIPCCHFLHGHMFNSSYAGRWCPVNDSTPPQFSIWLESGLANHLGGKILAQLFYPMDLLPYPKRSKSNNSFISQGCFDSYFHIV